MAMNVHTTMDSVHMRRHQTRAEESHERASDVNLVRSIILMESHYIRCHKYAYCGFTTIDVKFHYQLIVANVRFLPVNFVTSHLYESAGDDGE